MTPTTEPKNGKLAVAVLSRSSGVGVESRKHTERVKNTTHTTARNAVYRRAEIDCRLTSGSSATATAASTPPRVVNTFVGSSHDCATAVRKSVTSTRFPTTPPNAEIRMSVLTPRTARAASSWSPVCLCTTALVRSANVPWSLYLAAR
eukprot:Amastigsp_a178328_10.p2 type:complete len:148 gc:universal Amastigsp_a178328_10:1091-648(-)